MPLSTFIRTALVLCATLTSLVAAEVKSKVNFDQFLTQHDMKWDVLPHAWIVAPYSGNGNIGFTFYNFEGDQENEVSLVLGRHDYYDHRLPEGDRQHAWIYTCRLPLGRFQLQSVGKIIDADLNLGLYNAELTGTIKTTTGSYQIKGLTHSTTDVIQLVVTAENGEQVKIKWIPADPVSSVRTTLDNGGGPKKGATWDGMRAAPYPAPPKPEFGSNNSYQYCKQILYKHRGETTTAWALQGSPDAEQTLLASVHHSFPEKNSLETVVANLQQGEQAIAESSFISSHRAWWHAYYPQSFITLNDPEKEAFYWIQMYKLGSAMRENGPILDLMGPWYKYTFWPMVWGDLNVQLQYWTQLTSNRLSLGDSLPNNIDKYSENLKKNVPKAWKNKGELMHLGTCFPQDFISNNSTTPPDMLCWLLHNYWLQCKFQANEERLRDNHFPLLKQTMNTYFVWIGEEKLKGEGPITLPASWSPEYPAPWDEGCNFTTGLIRWAAQTLLDINHDHKLEDPLASEWQMILDRVNEYQIDENGLRVAKNTPFDIPHRHYSHLLAFYPLAELTPDEEPEMLRKSLDHWLEVTRQKGAQNKVTAMPVTGYTATGAASMYAWLGDAEQAYYYLNFLIHHENVSPNTMYAEGRNPVIESPLSFCTSLHDMVLQSYGRKSNVIRVLPACPKVWPDLAFDKFRAQGAFLVSAKRSKGITQFVQVESLAGSPCIVKTDIPSPVISINGKTVTVKPNDKGEYSLDLNKGDKALFTTKPLTEISEDELVIAPIEVAPKDHNLFGYSERTKRLPSHTNYKKK